MLEYTEVVFRTTVFAYKAMTNAHQDEPSRRVLNLFEMANVLSSILLLPWKVEICCERLVFSISSLSLASVVIVLPTRR